MPGTCVRCHNSVIYAERTNALGMVWHTRCYLCANCNKSLHNISVKDRDGVTFCEQCCAKLFKSEGCGQVIITAGSIDQSALVNESSDIMISSDVKYRINDSDIGHIWPVLGILRQQNLDRAHLVGHIRQHINSKTFVMETKFVEDATKRFI